MSGGKVTERSGVSFPPVAYLLLRVSMGGPQPIFDLEIVGIPAEIPFGIKHVSVVINDRRYNLFAMLHKGKDSLRFKGTLPMFPGRNTVVFSSPDIPGIVENRGQYDFPPYEADKNSKRLNNKLCELPGLE